MVAKIVLSLYGCKRVKPEIVIWAHSKCRSTFPLYRELAKLKVTRLVSREGVLDYRREQGDCEENFSNPPCAVIGENPARAREILAETCGAVHLVAAYQVLPMMREVMHAAKARGDKVFIISEAPWNAQRGLKKWIWEVYLRTVLKWRLRRVIREADAIVNYSGDQVGTAHALGWPGDKIVSFGYFTEGGGSSGKGVGGRRCLRRGRRGGADAGKRSSERHLRRWRSG